MSEKPKYSVDENNNLSIEKKGQKLNARGRFTMDKDNRLIYWLNEPSAWRRKYHLGKAFVFMGHGNSAGNRDYILKWITLTAIFSVYYALPS